MLEACYFALKIGCEYKKRKENEELMKPSFSFKLLNGDATKAWGQKEVKQLIRGSSFDTRE